MYESIILGKTYKTIKGYKTAMSRYETIMKSELADILDNINNGRKLYLGESIFKRKNDYKKELANIKKERKKLLGVPHEHEDLSEIRTNYKISAL